MKKRLLAVLMVILFVVSYSLTVSALSLPYFLETGKVNKGTKLYSRPSSKSQVVTSLGKNKSIKILAQTKNYYLIADGNVAGYVAKTRIDTNLSKQTLELAIESIKVGENSIGTPTLTVVFRNTGNEDVDAFEVYILGYDNFGDQLSLYNYGKSNTIIHQVKSVIIKPGKTYTLKDLDAYGFDNAVSFAIGVKRVHYGLGTTESVDVDDMYWYFGPRSPIFGTPEKLAKGDILADSAIYAEPDLTSEKLIQLSTGDTVSVAISNVDYYQVVSGNIFGYVPHEDVLLEKAIGFDVRGSTWGDSRQSVKSKEDTNSISTYVEKNDPTRLDYDIQMRFSPSTTGTSIDDTWNLAYIFTSDKLVECIISRRNKNNPIPIYYGFYNRLDELETVYGEPDYMYEFWESDASEYKKDMYWDALGKGDLSLVAKWEVDYTEIYLGADDEMCYISYRPK